MRKKILIIGAGIAGLSTGCYAQMNNYDSEIFELHNLPGGLCTSWKRKEYLFDGCIHWLIGINPSNPFHKFWLELGALKNQEIIVYNEFMRCESSDGRTLVVYSDMDKFKQHLLDIAPEDTKSINEIIEAVKNLSKMEMPVEKSRDMYTFSDFMKIMIKTMPYMKYLSKYQKVSIADFISKKFSNDFLKETLVKIIPQEYSMFALLMTLVSFHSKDAGWPIGGSLEFAKSIEKRYLDLGGKINYKTKINQIIVKNNKAIGIRTEDGKEFFGDIVISSLNSFDTINTLLDGKYSSNKIMKNYGKYPTYTSIQISLGLDCDLSHIPKSSMLLLDQPLNVGNENLDFFQFNNYHYDHTLYPKDCGIINCIIFSNFAYWTKLREDKTRYNNEKNKLAKDVITILESRYPSIKNHIKVVDVATPYTYYRYTNVWKGAYMAWITTPGYSSNLPKIIPELQNLYFVGQWTFQGGLPSAMITGRWIIQKICKEDKKIFR